MMQPLWRSRAIDSIQIVMTESATSADRASRAAAMAAS
jgi:hypothetical protein